MQPLHVVILAAGHGTRMHSDLPKVLHQIGGRALLEHVVEAASGVGPAAVHVVYGHGGERVPETLSHLPVGWVRQDEQLGTGHAVQQAMPGVAHDAAVLVLYGDVPLVEPATLARVVAPGANGGVGLLTVELDDPSGYGRILRDAGGEVVGIVEEKDATASQRAVREINTGILCAPAAALAVWLDRIGNDNAQREFYLTDVVAMAVGDGVSVEAVQAGDPTEVLGVNDRVQLAVLERAYQRRETRRLMLAGVTMRDPERVDVRGRVHAGRDVVLDVNVVLEGEVRLGDRVAVGPNTVIRNSEIAAGSEVLANCLVDDARIGAGCRIGPFARIRPGTRLAEDVHIGNFVEVKNTSLGAGSKANHLTYLGDAEIGSGVNVGAGTITCNYDGASKHRTVIGDGAFIGSGVELIAPVTVNAGATIGAGSTISRDAPRDALTVTRARQTTIDGWRRPVKRS